MTRKTIARKKSAGTGQDVKRVLVISYFWPPSGKASAHWPVSMVRYLPSNGWKASVLTVERDTFSHADTTHVGIVDPSVDVVRARALEPFNLYRRLLGKKREEPLVASEAISKSNRGFRHRLAVWIRMNLFVPDARVGWYWHAVRAGRVMLSRTRFNAVLSVGPPHTTHLVGRTLSRLAHLPHIPVLIDPWVDIVYYREFRRNPLALRLDRHFEKSVLENAAGVVFVTGSMRDDYVRKYPSIGGKSEVLYWGFSEEEFRQVRAARRTKEQLLIHAGNLFDYQNPPALWPALLNEIRRGKNMQLLFIGTVGPGVRAAIEHAGLAGRTTYLGFLPYREMLGHLRRARALLVCATEPRHVPGKLFEYLRIGKPILAFGDDNEEVAGILEQTGGGMLFRYSEDPTPFFRRMSSMKIRRRAVQAFSREAIAGRLAGFLDARTLSGGEIPLR